MPTATNGSPGEIALRRTYTFSESEVLARDTQEQRLLRDMQTDAVQQMVRRLRRRRSRPEPASDTIFHVQAPPFRMDTESRVRSSV